jgi:hypothetical protein
LSYQRWAIVYEKRHFSQANTLFERFMEAQSKLGINVEEPSWIEIEHSGDTYGCERELRGLIEIKKRPSIVFIMLGNEHKYKAFKQTCYSLNLISQCIRY